MSDDEKKKAGHKHNVNPPDPYNGKWKPVEGSVEEKFGVKQNPVKDPPTPFKIVKGG